MEPDEQAETDGTDDPKNKVALRIKTLGPADAGLRGQQFTADVIHQGADQGDVSGSLKGGAIGLLELGATYQLVKGS